MQNTNALSAQEKDQLLQKYMQLVERYERLMEISRQLSSTLDLNVLLERIILAAIELTDTEAASILLIDPQTDELRFEAASDMSSGTRDALVVPKEGSVAGWVVTHGEHVLVPDAPDDPRWYQEVEKSVPTKTRNMLAVPMRSHTRVIGALEAINKRDDISFTEDDIDTLMTLAAQAAVAIENSRLFQQNDFIAELVHELRTPLTALKASAALLLRPTLPPEIKTQTIQTIEQETDRLRSMTTEFLDLARLESGRTRLELTPFNLQDLVTETISIILNQAREHDIAVRMEGPGLIVNADRAKLKQVLLNLLTNAIKYNRPGGEIVVSISTSEDAHRISVRDTGRGISERDQAHIFERFYRVSDDEGYIQGTGLGLVIAKRIVEAHGGSMWLESTIDVGSTFVFTVPHRARNAVQTAISTGP